MKQRFSDVIAWGGFLYFILLMFPLNDERGYRHIPFVLGVWVGCAIANYIMVGRFRIIPWALWDEKG